MPEWNLSSLIERGGVYHQVPGRNQKELLAAIISLLPSDPAFQGDRLLKEILDREALVSTGIGKGIALPHPRSPMVTEDKSTAAPLVAVAFPAQPLDWNTPDGSKVNTVFLIVSISTKQHLNALSKINFLCQQKNFYSLIASQASKDEIIAAIQDAENEWARSIL
ncbi:MAG: PTS sugar transporter subunit IIA [Treponema sp.]|nr:PTS sugar transporter subunit IIA [Treponema sp.]